MVLRGIFILWHVPMVASVMMYKGFDMVKSFGYIFMMTLVQLPGYFTVSLADRTSRAKMGIDGVSIRNLDQCLSIWYC